MAFITDILNTIKNARKGKDMRQAIYDGIQQCYKDATGHPDSVAAVVERLKIEKGRIDELATSQTFTGNYTQSNLVFHAYRNATTGDPDPDDSYNYEGTSGKHEMPICKIFQEGTLDFAEKQSNEKVKILKEGLYIFELRIFISGSGKLDIEARINDVSQRYNAWQIVAQSTEETKIIAYILYLKGDDVVSFYGTPGLQASVRAPVSDVNCYVLDWIGKAQISDCSKEISDIRVGADGNTYPTAGEAIREQIGNLTEDLSNKITKFYASNQGETHITDSDNGKIMDMMVYGKSEQKSTMGKNLLKISEVNVQGSANGLLSIMNTDGSISVTGTSTSTWSNIIKINNECHTDNATYTFSVDKNPGIIIGLKLGRTKLDDANYQTHRIMQNQLSCTFETGASNEYCSLFLEGLTVGKSYNFTIYPMLELGTEATAYEPYTGGQPSPSPDYPQEIKSVVNPTVKVCGKNLLKISEVNVQGSANGLLSIMNTDGSISVTGTSTSTWSNIIKINNECHTDNATYTFSVDKNPGIIIGLKLGRTKLDDANYQTHRIMQNQLSCTFETGASNEYCSLFLEGLTVGKSYNFTIYPMLELGTEATAYEPYKEQTIQLPVTLNAIPVSSGGNVTIDGQQYITDYVNVERGKLVKMVDSSKLDNTQSIVNKTEWLLAEPQEIDLTTEEITALKELATYYPVTNISVNSEQLDGYTVFNYQISMQNGWNYVKQQLNDNRDYIYDMDTKTQDIDTQAAEAYVNSEYAVALTELEV